MYQERLLIIGSGKQRQMKKYKINTDFMGIVWLIRAAIVTNASSKVIKESDLRSMNIQRMI